MSDAKDPGAAHIVLQDSQIVIGIAQGRFSSVDALSEFAIASSNALELCRITAKGHFQVMSRMQLHTVICAIATVPSQAATHCDQIAITTNSGRLTLLRFDAASNQWQRHAYDSFGKSGIRRTVPGHYLAVDPRGRAVMVAAMEKCKFVYPIRATKKVAPAGTKAEDDDPRAEDADADLWTPTDDDKFRLGSALEAHKAHCVVYSLVALDNTRNESPQFAALEHHRDSMVVGEKAVVVYEHDVGLNHVVRLWTYPCHSTSSLLVRYPSATSAPAGAVIVLAEDHAVALSHDGRRVRQAEAYFPRRKDYPFEAGGLFSVASASVVAKRGQCFMVVQNELGDVFRLELNVSPNEIRDRMTLKYLDTLPTATTLMLTVYGHLFVAAEAQDHAVYHVESEGPADDSYLSGPAKYNLQHSGTTVSIYSFERSDRLKHLTKLATLPNHAPVCAACPLRRASNPLDSVRLVGRGASAAVCVMQYGHTATVTFQKRLPVEGFDAIFSVVKPLARGEAPPLWAGERHCRLVATRGGGTMVFDASDSDHALVQNNTAGFITSVRTLAVSTLPGGFGFLQIHSGGFRQVEESQSVDWAHGFSKAVVAACCSATQAMLAFQHGGLYVFQLDGMGRMTPTHMAEEHAEALCVAFVPSADGHSRFAGVGLAGLFAIVETAGDRALMKPVSKLACSSDPCSTTIVETDDHQIYAFIGLCQKGALIRVTIDPTTGKMIDFVQFTLGEGRCQVLPSTSSQRCPFALVVCDGQLYKAGTVDGSHQVVPVRLPSDHRATVYAAPFAGSAMSVDTVVVLDSTGQTLSGFATSSGTAHVRRLERNERTAGMTARRVVVHPNFDVAAVLFSDHRGSWSANNGRYQDPNGAPAGSEGTFAWRLAVFDLNTFALRATFDPFTEGLVKEQSSEAALCMTSALLGGQHVLSVGVVPNFVAKPPDFDANQLPMIVTFRFERDELRRLHSTTIDCLPSALAALTLDNGLLLAGCGKSLRGFEMGTRQLLRKCELSNVVKTRVAHIATQGSMIAVCDVHESVVFVKYFPGYRRGATVALPVFVAVADHFVPRHVTCCTFVDALTCAVGDRFGNIAVLRVAAAAAAASNAIAAELQQENAADTVAGGLQEENELAKATEIITYHVGSTLVSVFPFSTPSRGQLLVYATVTGETGVLAPLGADDHEDLEKAVALVREQVVPVAGREHLAYRSTYGPVKGVIDLDYIRHGLNSLSRSECDALDEAFVTYAKDKNVFRATVGKAAVAEIRVPSIRDAVAEVRQTMLGGAN